MNSKKIIVLVGTIGAGKGLISDYLIEQYGFSYYSLSKALKNHLTRQGVTEFTRESLQDAGDQLRKERNNPAALVDIIVEEEISKDPNDKIIFDGVRNPGEIARIKELFSDVKVIGVDAPQELRFQRVISRNRESDPKTWEEFVARDERDNGENETDPHRLSNRNCLKLADTVIVNEGSPESVYEEIYSEVS